MVDHQKNTFSIQTLNQISPLGLDRFPKDRYHIGANIASPDAVLVRSHDMLNMAIPESVLAIGRAGAGTNNIPVQAMSKRGVPVFNTPGANANAVKELVIAGLLIAARNLLPALRFVETLQGNDDALHQQVEKEKKRFSGIELPGRTLGIIGLGEIGRLVADAALKMGMKVVGYDPNITVESAWSLSSEVKKANTLEALLRYSDFITVHVPLLDSTLHLINEKSISLMKQDVIVLNFSRNRIANEDAILDGIASRKIKYYVCDFPSQKLQHHEAVITLPHLGASTQEAEENCAIMVIHQLIDFLQNGNIKNTVNFPNIGMERESPHRIAIANANVPNIVGQVSTCMAKAGLNIHNMVNKSRGEMAYTLVDVDSPVPQKVIEAIALISGVLSVRYVPFPIQ
ncbi:MAG: phosphoglycerate dehydrogenase [Nitrosomonas sp.]|nr:phosphoglycerate dehydrogenase [Nitrosomonas sp.]